MTVIFSVMALGFSIPGILNLTGNGNWMNGESVETSTNTAVGLELPALLIGFGFAFL